MLIINLLPLLYVQSLFVLLSDLIIIGFLFLLSNQSNLLYLLSSHKLDNQMKKIKYNI